MTKDLFKKTTEDLSKALGHLTYSLAKSSQILKKAHFSEDEIKIRIGEQKIDLKIISHADAKTDAFTQSVLPSAVRLS